jgi:hypothetical protein
LVVQLGWVLSILIRGVSAVNRSVRMHAHPRTPTTTNRLVRGGDAGK